MGKPQSQAPKHEDEAGSSACGGRSRYTPEGISCPCDRDPRSSPACHCGVPFRAAAPGAVRCDRRTACVVGPDGSRWRPSVRTGRLDGSSWAWPRCSEPAGLATYVPAPGGGRTPVWGCAPCAAAAAVSLPISALILHMDPGQISSARDGRGGNCARPHPAVCVTRRPARLGERRH